MTEIKEKRKYNKKEREFLDETQAENMRNYLKEKRGNQQLFADEIGVTTQSISAWSRKRMFPKLCGMFLKLLELGYRPTRK